MKLEAEVAKECKAANIPKHIKATNEAMIGCVSELRKLNMQPFDANVSKLDNFETVNSILVVHRILKKFNVPGNSKACREAAMVNYLLYDMGLREKEVKLHPWTHPYSHVFRKARLEIQQIVRKFPFNLYDVTDVVFTPGETFIGQKGETSIAAKLLNKSHWSVSESAFEYACDMICACPGLKKMARFHIGPVSKEETRFLYSVYSGTGDVGRQVFKHLLRERVLTVVEGARASTVPKNTDTDRFINIEPLFNVLLQRAIAAWLRKILKVTGNTLGVKRGEYSLSSKYLFESQLLHGLMLKDLTYWTVDFKNASDSTLKSSVELVLGTYVYDLCMRARSPAVLVENLFYEPNKMSSMGNGFTFELMTLVISSIARLYDRTARVFGDDLIIKGGNKATEVLSVLSALGYEVNHDKTFIDGRVRESCGYFVYHSDTECHYMVSFDFQWCVTYTDCIITHNKLKTILTEAVLSDPVRAILEKTCDHIYTKLPRFSRGSMPSNSKLRRKHMASYVFSTSDLSRSQMKNNALRKCYNQLLKSEAITALQLATKVDGVSELDRSNFGIYQYWLPKRTKFNKAKAKFLCALLNGSSDGQVVRGEGKWIQLPVLILRNGHMFLLRDLLRNKTTEIVVYVNDKTM